MAECEMAGAPVAIVARGAVGRQRLQQREGLARLRFGHTAPSIALLIPIEQPAAEALLRDCAIKGGA